MDIASSANMQVKYPYNLANTLVSDPNQHAYYPCKRIVGHMTSGFITLSIMCFNQMKLNITKKTQAISSLCLLYVQISPNIYEF